MSIGPVQSAGSAGAERPAQNNSPAAQSETASASSPISGRSAANEEPALEPSSRSAARSNESAELSPDEVQLQRSSQDEDQIVIKYVVSATGSVILQVPSNQVLDVGRGIQQEFARQAKSEENAETVRAASSGGKTYGD
jgi:uncharacterized FlaG/YvyC family protein